MKSHIYFHSGRLLLRDHASECCCHPHSDLVSWVGRDFCVCFIYLFFKEKRLVNTCLFESKLLFWAKHQLGALVMSPLSLVIWWALTYGWEYEIIKGLFKGESEIKLYNSPHLTNAISFLSFYALVLHLLEAVFIQTTPYWAGMSGRAAGVPGHGSQSPLVTSAPSPSSLDPFLPASPHLSQPTTTATSKRKKPTASQKSYYLKDSLTRPGAF